jgi:hypothetical protein
MTEREISVTVKKMVSDGDYGHEEVQVTLSGFVEDEDDTDSVDEERILIRALLNSARRYVHTELYRSPSPRIRGALAPVPGPHPTDLDSEYEDEGDEAPLPL